LRPILDDQQYYNTGLSSYFGDSFVRRHGSLGMLRGMKPAVGAGFMPAFQFEQKLFW